ANTFYQAKPLALVDLTQPVKVIEPKVASEHVLYEFQQTPTDSISNVHVKQLFEPDLKPPPPIQPNNPPANIITSETIVSPAQQQPFAQNNLQTYSIKHHPLYNVQPTFAEPKKYVYGKIIVDSTQPGHFMSTPTSFHSSQQFTPHLPNQPSQFVQFTHGKPIISYINHYPRNNPTQLPPITQPRFRPPPLSQYQTIDMPVLIEKQQKEKPKPRPPVIEKPVKEDNIDSEDDDTEEKLDYEENERDEYESPFDKYFEHEDADDEKDHEGYEETGEETEEDNKRGSSSYSRTEYRPKKLQKPKKTHRGKHPEDRYIKDKYKSYKYKHAKKSKYPHSELDGRFSEPIPTTHKKKILKEQWYLSKSLRDKFENE
ncbi:unnamed protein product, partial [Phyllotreta striolata]